MFYAAAAVIQTFNKMPLKRLDCNDCHSEEIQDELLADDSDVFDNRSSNLTLEIGLGDINDEPCKSYFITINISIHNLSCLSVTDFFHLKFKI